MHARWRGPLGRFRVVSLAEGVSYLLLVGLGMPLKYGADWPLAVRVFGMLHGLLFVVFIVTLADATLRHPLALRRSLLAFLLSLVPGGAFWLEHRHLPRWAEDGRRAD